MEIDILEHMLFKIGVGTGIVLAAVENNLSGVASHFLPVSDSPCVDLLDLIQS